MSTIQVKLTDSENIVLNEIEKNHLFFVGKPGEATNAVFEKAYEITHENWPENVFASFEIGSRQFTNLSFSAGKTLSKAKGTYRLKKHTDGTMYLCMNMDYPAHDSYERMYSCHFQRVVYRDNGKVVVIQAKFGSILPKINVFIGLKESVPYLDALLDILDKSDSAQMTRLTMLTRCVAQKYRLSDEQAEQMENFVIYTCLDAANISASFGIFKSKKQSLSYDLLKAIADYVCGTCFEEWYGIAPRRRYERLSELIDYMRHLKRDKFVEWSAEEKAFCHNIRRYIDSSVFADVYAVSLVFLRFLAENDFRDVYSFRAAAISPGVFSSTLMADTVDRFSAGQLDGEAKQVFFSLVGKNADNVKVRVERALYRYHVGSNALFRATEVLTKQSGLADTKRDANAMQEIGEKAALCAAAKVAVATRESQNGTAESNDDFMHEIAEHMCQKMAEIYEMNIVPVGEEGEMPFAGNALMKIGNICLAEERYKLLSKAGKTVVERRNEFLPENNFVFMYTLAFIFIQILLKMVEKFDSFENILQEFEYNPALVGKEALQMILLEAKYRYGAMCGADLLESMAQSE